jgi:glycosyltransferase involved in cell wall biosynthesis
MIRTLGLENRVQLLGECSDIFDQLSQGHILWQSSQSEGLPLVCIEAMANGLPVIATNVRGNRDVIAHGVTGFLVNDGDASSMAESSLCLLSDPSRYRAFAEASRERVQRLFNRDEMVRNHISALTLAATDSWTHHIAPPLEAEI